MIEAMRGRYISICFGLYDSRGAAVEPNDVILTNLMTSHCFNPISLPISSLGCTVHFYSCKFGKASAPKNLIV